MKFRGTLVSVGLVAALIVSPAGPAASDDLPLVFVYNEALIAVTEELSFLVMLDRVEQPAPPDAKTMPGNIGLFPGPKGFMEDELAFLDQELGPDVLDELRLAGETVTPEVVEVLSVGPSLTTDDVDANVYLIAYRSLLDRWVPLGGLEFEPGLLDVLGPGGGHPPSLAIEPPPTTVVVTTTAASPATEPAPQSSAAATTAVAQTPTTDAPVLTATSEVAAVSVGADDSSMPVAVVGIVAVLAAAAALLFGRRRVKARRPDAIGAGYGPSRDDVLDAGRRILAVQSPGELADLVAERAMSLTGASGAIFMFGEEHSVAGLDPSVPAELIERVRSTGRTVQSSGLSIVPVVTDGVVTGLLATSGEHIDVLLDLAPLVGGGMANVTSRQETEAMAFVDGLTGVHNRRRFDIDLGEMSRTASAGGVPVAVAMFDVDNFKIFNDTNGHQAGDAALQQVAQLIEENIRSCDMVYRYGGEEFAALLPGASLEEAHAVVERVRLAIEGNDFDGASSQPGGRVTMSIGVATTPPADGNAMLRAADTALYAAKTQGRNQVVVAPDPREQPDDSA